MPSTIDWQSLSLPHAVSCLAQTLSTQAPQSVLPKVGAGGGEGAGAGSALGALSVFSGVLSAAAESAEPVRGPALPAYPLATQDVALVVPEEVPAAEVVAALRAGAGELLEDVRLFDVYTGAQLGAGTKSLAYTLRLRAPDRTLTAAEATAARDAAVAEAARRTGAVLRA